MFVNFKKKTVKPVDLSTRQDTQILYKHSLHHFGKLGAPLMFATTKHEGYIQDNIAYLLGIYIDDKYQPYEEPISIKMDWNQQNVCQTNIITIDNDVERVKVSFLSQMQDEYSFKKSSYALSRQYDQDMSQKIIKFQTEQLGIVDESICDNRIAELQAIMKSYQAELDSLEQLKAKLALDNIQKQEREDYEDL